MYEHYRIDDQVATDCGPRGAAPGTGNLARLHSKYSRQDYTQHQLFALLAPKTFFKTDYRGVVPMLADLAPLRHDLGPTAPPHSSTLCYVAKRLLKKGVRPAPLPRHPARPRRRLDRPQANGRR